jgi:Tfp pilus assembly protein PilF
VALWPAQLVKIRAGMRGSGWAVGRCGVLTARHVVRKHLDNPYDPAANASGLRCLAVTGGLAGQGDFGCAVVWQDEAADLALLKIAEGQREVWQARLIDEAQAVLAAPGTDPIPGVSAIGFPDATLDADANRPDPDQPTGILLPGAGVPDMIGFDVSNSTPGDHPLWKGLSGAAIREGGSGRLFAIVAQAPPDRDARRLYASPLPDPATNPEWAAALEDVGARPILEDRYAPEARRSLTCYDAAGRPWRVRSVPQLGDFGVRRARDDLAPHDQPYFPFVGRPEAGSAEIAIKAALADAGAPRMVLLVGESAAGKSRLAAEVVRRIEPLGDYRFIRPRATQSIGDLPAVLLRGRVLLWLDDLQHYFASDLDEQWVKSLLENPQLVIVATILRASLKAQTQSLFRTGATGLLTDDALIARIDVTDTPAWSVGDGTDPEDAGVARAALAAAQRAGVGLGEYLAAYDELRNRYKNTGPWARALIDCVADWARTGISTALPEPLARDLWPAHYFSANQAQRWGGKTDDDRDSIYQDALQEATEPALGSTALLDRTRNGLLASEVVLSERQAVAVPDDMWTAAAARVSAEDPAHASSVAFQAALVNQFRIAEMLWAPLINQEPAAAINLGTLRKKQGDLAGAEAAYKVALDSGHGYYAPAAAVNLGLLRQDQGDLAGAEAAYQIALDSGHTEAAPAAAVNLGLLRRDQGDLAGAEAAYQIALDSGHAEVALPAAVNLGTLRMKQGDLAGAEAAYQIALDSGHADYTPRAAFNLGALREQQGDLAGAEAAYQIAADSGHADYAPRAAINLGLLRQEQGDLAGAEAAYQTAIDSGHADYAPRAAFNLGVLRQQQGDLAGAEAAYQIAADSGHTDHGPAAAVNLGLLRQEQGDLAGAEAAYQTAIDSGHADAAPAADFNLGVLRQQQGDVTEAEAAYQIAADSGHTDAAPAANFHLGLLRQEQGDLAGAEAAYQTAADSGHADYAPRAAFNLGVLRQEQGDLAEAEAAYQTAIDSGHANYAPQAAGNLGLLRKQQGDLAGAEAAYQTAADSGHADAAPAANFHLGLLCQEQGDLAGAEAAYQTAIDSGHADYAPPAAVNLGVVREQQGDLAGAETAYQVAVDSGHADSAPAAACGLGLLRTKRGDLAGAGAAYQMAVDSGHGYYAPAAAVKLGVVREEQGDLAGAETAYQVAIDSGHADYAPRAAFNLGVLREQQGGLAGGCGGLPDRGRLRPP